MDYDSIKITLIKINTFSDLFRLKNRLKLISLVMAMLMSECNIISIISQILAK